MKPRPGVPFSWYFKENFSWRDHGEVSSLVLRKGRLSRQFHNVGYYEHANNTWATAGKWKDLSEETYHSPIFFGFQYFDRAARLLRKNSPWRIG